MAGCAATSYAPKQSSEFIDIELSFDQDTVMFNDSLQVTIWMKNTMDDPVTIFPKARIILNHNHLGFISGGDKTSTLYLNYKINDTEYARLDPDSSFSISCSLKVKEDFFLKGENYLYIIYACRLPEGTTLINPVTYAVSNEKIVYIK